MTPPIKMHDLRLAWRLLAKEPAYSAVAILDWRWSTPITWPSRASGRWRATPPALALRDR
jgi:hypothetical protein